MVCRSDLIGGADMLGRLCRASLILALGAGLAACAQMADLPAKQQQTAACMVSAVSGIPEASDAKLIRSNDRREVFLTYMYHHRDKTTDQAKLNITKLLSDVGKPHYVTIGGLLGPAGLDDADRGLPRIFELWRSKCGINVLAISV